MQEKRGKKLRNVSKMNGKAVYYDKAIVIGNPVLDPEIE